MNEAGVIIHNSTSACCTPTKVVDEKEGICSNEGNEEGWVVPSFTTSRTNGWCFFACFFNADISAHDIFT